MAPVSLLRDADGRLVRELERADVEPLLATGWKWPERFIVKARDGTTDLYGLVYRNRPCGLQIITRRAILRYRRDVEGLSRFILIDVRRKPAHKIMANELVGPLDFLHYRRLPGQETCDDILLDTAAALRALEIRAQVILKATKVDGIFSADPMIEKTAKKFMTIHYIDFLKKGLKVMDLTAISLCQDNSLPILVFNLNKHGNIKKAVLAEKIGTLVC